MPVGHEVQALVEKLYSYGHEMQALPVQYGEVAGQGTSLALAAGMGPTVGPMLPTLVALGTTVDCLHTFSWGSKYWPVGQLVHLSNFMSKSGVAPVQLTQETPL